jgi:hypothetical protein
MYFTMANMVRRRYTEAGRVCDRSELHDAWEYWQAERPKQTTGDRFCDPMNPGVSATTSQSRHPVE